MGLNKVTYGGLTVREESQEENAKKKTKFKGRKGLKVRSKMVRRSKQGDGLRAKEGDFKDE